MLSNFVVAVAAAGRCDDAVMATSDSEYNSREGADVETLPEVPDDGVLIKALYAGVCHATHSPLDSLADTTSFVGQ